MGEVEVGQEGVGEEDRQRCGHVRCQPLHG